MVLHSTLPDFVLFLYVHLAQIDESYDPSELSAIKTKMKVLFPEGTDVEKKLYQAIREYKKFDKSKIGQFCSDSLAHFKGEGNNPNPRVIADLADIIRADGHIEKSEADALSKLQLLFAEFA